MLHIFNRAWGKILIKQAIANPNKKFLFVISVEEEPIATELVAEMLNTPGSVYAIDVITVDDLKFRKIFYDWHRFKPTMYDDVLVTSKLHDIFLKDFLSKCCKRKCC